MKIEVDIKDELLASVIDSALHNNHTTQWCEGTTYDEKAIGTRSIGEFLLSGGAVTFIHDRTTKSGNGDGSPRKRTTIDRSAIEPGLRAMVSKIPHHFADLVGEGDDADAETGDYLLQFCLFGDVEFE